MPFPETFFPELFFKIYFLSPAILAGVCIRENLPCSILVFFRIIKAWAVMRQPKFLDISPLSHVGRLIKRHMLILARLLLHARLAVHSFTYEKVRIRSVFNDHIGRS